MDIIDIKAWIKATQNKYVRKNISGISYCPDLHSYIISFKDNNMWISVHPKYPYIDMSDNEKTCTKHPITNHLKDMVISNIQIENTDVVIKITFSHKYLPSQNKFMFVEMQRHKSNLILTDKNLRIVYTHKEIEDIRYGRTLWVGSIYAPPPTKGTISIENIEKSLENLSDKTIIRGISKERRKYFSNKDILQLWKSIKDSGKTVELDGYLHIVDTTNQAIVGEFYEYYIAILELEHQKNVINQKTKQLKREKKKLQKLLSKLESEFQSTQDYQKYKFYGDAILTFMTMPSSKNFFSFTNWETGEVIEIPIEPGKTPAELATSYYKKYKHLKKKRENVQTRIKEVKEKLANINSVIENQESNEILIKDKNKKPYLKLKDEYGNIYIIGKNRLGNHIVSFRLASRKHWWFHVKNFPGSHVILKPKNNTITEYAIVTAAKLAAYFSKLKESSKAEVIYTKRKNIKPVKGELGLVIYKNEKSIIVAPESPDEMGMKSIG